MKEDHSLEFKEAPSASFLKTISAFANYDGGTIVFGVRDDGTIVGLTDPHKTCLNIENKVNGSISPQPDYSIAVNDANDTVELTVRSSPYKPYLYHGRAYRRSDIASLPVDQLELRRLVLAGQNLTFESLPSANQDLTFTYLGKLIKGRLGIKEFDSDTLRTLGLLDRNRGYNNAAALLADENDFPGLDIARFGESISIIKKRSILAGSSILNQFDQAISLYRDYYVQEEVHGSTRTEVQLLPEAAFREALANALVHRTWDIEAQTRVSFFDDRVEVSSPGGLPTDMTEEEYLSDRVSVLRNPVLAGVFYRLGLIEAYGTGVQRIRACYAQSINQPDFTITDNTTTVCLPLIADARQLTHDQDLLLSHLSQIIPKGMTEIARETDLSRSKATRLIHELVRLQLVRVEGAGRNTRYLRTSR